jgi:hypothetical protein
MTVIPELGVGIGWRAEIDLTVERLPGVDFVEVVAENLHAEHLPESVVLLRERGIPGPAWCPAGARRQHPTDTELAAELAAVRDVRARHR